MSHTTWSGGAGFPPLPWQGWTHLCTGRERSFRGGRKIQMGKNKPPECFCCSFPFRADHSVVNIQPDISCSNCLHMLLLEEFQSPPLRAEQGGAEEFGSVPFVFCWRPCLECSCRVTQCPIVILARYLGGRRELKHVF